MMTSPHSNILRLALAAVTLLVLAVLGGTITQPAHAFYLTKQTSSTISKLNARDCMASSLNMCICVDCARVTNCAAYHFVETKHEQPHMTEDPTFEPQDGSPTIHVNIRSIRNREDQLKEVQRMWREHKAETERAEQAAAMEEEAGAVNTAKPNSNDGDEDDPSGLHGSEVYDLTPMTTYEYDVVACADYVEDKGCWVRNMPQEIRDANPDFVPS